MKTISSITASDALKRAATSLLLEQGSAVGDGGTTMLDTSGVVRLSA